MKYSIVIPLYNEEESIDELYIRVKEVMDSIASSNYEILFVNDGSTDSSSDKVYKLKKKDKSVRMISFRKNLGKSAGLSAGFKNSKGEIIITMDGDLQDEPKEIPKLLAKIEEGYDLVSGWKENRQDPMDKTLPSKVFNYTVSTLTGLNFHDFNCGFKAYRRQVVDEIILYGQLYRFIPVLADERGFKCAEVKVKHNKRKYGKSKYNWKRFFAGIFDIFTIVYFLKFDESPMHLMGFTGFLLFILSLFSLLMSAFMLFLKSFIPALFLIISCLLFLSLGFLSIFIGLVAEQAARKDSSARKYQIKQVV